MTNAQTSSRLRRRGQHGSAIMEFALIMFPFFALIFGIMSVTYLIFLKGVVQNAARTGCRWAITFNRGTYDGINCSSQQDSCIKAVVQDNALGFLGSSASSSQYQYIVINYYPPFNLNTPIAASQLPITSTDSNFANVTYMNQTNNVVEVTVTGLPVTWLPPLGGDLTRGFVQRAFTINASASDVLEGYGVNGASGTLYPGPPTAGPPY